jgi:L-2-hydroxyglutarate oxidase
MQKKVVIIGGGIVGLATALRLAEMSSDFLITVIEKEAGPAQHQTGNNSGVIHSGIYYKPGSLKAINCREGYHQLLEFCDKYKVPYELCGKLIVATSEEELPALQRIFERGQENGLENLRWIEADEIKEIEPYAAGIKAILVPQTGIVSYKVMASKMAELIVSKGHNLSFGEKVMKVIQTGKTVQVKTNRKIITTDYVVNCAGLYSDKIFSGETGLSPTVKIIPFRGEYYKLREDRRHLVRNLIYPVPDPAFPFLGVHFTRRIDGEIEAGPNAVLAFKREGYNKTSFDLKEFIEILAWPGFRKVALKYWKTGMGEFYRSWSKAAFTKALQKLLPSITAQDLEKGGAGVRAQACLKDGNLIDDFLIEQSGNVMHVLNAPSPAATSSLSIGKTLALKVIELSKG